jgi:hypothetical protein
LLFVLFIKYNSNYEAKEDELRGAYSTNGEEEEKGKRPLERPRHRCMDNIRMELGEIDWGGVDWIGLAEDRDQWRALVNVVINLRVP